MAGELPPYYFRVRENGAFVFRVDTENRQRRIEMDQIAVVNINNGRYGSVPMEAIRSSRPRWMAAPSPAPLPP